MTSTPFIWRQDCYSHMKAKYRCACVPLFDYPIIVTSSSYSYFTGARVCMYVCVFMALITTLVLCARSQDLVMSCQCVGYMLFSRLLLDLRAEESRVVRHVKPPRYREASRRPRALSRVRTHAIGALAQGSYSWISIKGGEMIATPIT